MGKGELKGIKGEEAHPLKFFGAGEERKSWEYIV